ncbi:MAG: aromatic-ring-hydroxylating dioxygenase subunit beta, partial [Alphaproteobacteria bacterium]|nr:aromatic-ring-hydroxylating dioxygenase subunit beta [Alphaproteobacteria bacterium]
MIDWETHRRIEDFLLDCAWAIDEDDLEAWPGFFAEDGRYRITTRDNEVRGLPVGIMLCEERGMMEDRVLALRTANIFEPHRYRHILGRPRLREAEGGLVRSDSSFIVMRTMQDGRMDLFAAG